MYGTMIVQARHARGLAQTQLAALSGLAQANISAIEHGHRVPTAATLHRLLHACGFELTASAGPDRVIACAPPPGDPLIDDLLRAPSGEEPPIVTWHTPMAERVRVLTAALDGAEAIVRGR